MKIKLITISLLFVLFGACAPVEDVVASQNGIEVLNAWARAAGGGMGGGQAVSGVFMTIRNTNAEGDRLIAATSAVAEFVELHEMNMNNGVMRMGEIDGLDISAGASIAFESDGYHIMLINLNQSLEAGMMIEVNLQFEKAGTFIVPVQVLNP